MKKIIIVLFSFFIGLHSAKSQVVINEYSASNLNLIADYAGKFSDYVELYNTSGTAVATLGFFFQVIAQ